MAQTQIISKADRMAAMLAQESQPLSHKEMTAHIRGRIKHEGIQARVRLYESCGSLFIQVFGTTYEQDFTDDEQGTIRTIAVVNSLTWVQGMPIDIEQMTNPKQFNFQFNG